MVDRTGLEPAIPGAQADGFPIEPTCPLLGGHPNDYEFDGCPCLIPL